MRQLQVHIVCMCICLACPSVRSLCWAYTSASLWPLETCGSDGTEHVAGEGSKLLVKGLFYGIGHQPNSQLVAGQIDLDDHGYVKV